MIVLGRFSPAAVSVVSALALAGCAGSGGGLSGMWGGSRNVQPAAAPAAAPDIPATILPSEVVGRWGYASFHEAKDRTRTETSARGQCNHPYLINPGPSGGVMMYPPDQSELVEYRLKGGQGGKNYIGPAGEPGGGQKDQEIVSFDGRVMTLRAVDPDVASRYGTGVYVRCAPAAGSVAQGAKGKK
jgi:hypothetical protein